MIRPAFHRWLLLCYFVRCYCAEFDSLLAWSAPLKWTRNEFNSIDRYIYQLFHYIFEFLIVLFNRLFDLFIISIIVIVFWKLKFNDLIQLEFYVVLFVQYKNNSFN